MNNIVYILFISLFSCFVTGISVAQSSDEDNNLGTEDVVVVKDYEARIADADRLFIGISDNPEKASVSSLTYQIPDYQIDAEYPAHIIKPLAKPNEKYKTPSQSFIRLGFGTQLTPLANIAYNDYSQENLHFGGWFDHLSSKGKRANQKYRENALGIYANYFFKKIELGGKIGFNQDVHYFYGYDEEDTSFASTDVKQRIRVYSGQIYIKNSGLNKKNVSFNQNISFNQLSDFYGVSEYTLVSDFSLLKTFESKHILNTQFKADISNLKPILVDDFEREIFQLGGSYTFDNDDWKLRGGLVLAFGDVTRKSQVNLYPDIYTEKRLYKSYLIFYSAWNRTLNKQSYQSVLSQNPYINTDVHIDNARVEDRLAGFMGAAKGFTYNIRFSNKVIKNMPLYVNDRTDMKRFDLVYERNLTIINLNLESGYQWKENLKTILNFDFLLYEPDEQEKAWHLPSIKANITNTYNYKDLILFRLDVIGLSGAYGRAEDLTAKKIKGTADINVHVDYRFSKYLSFFLHLNNLAGLKYERWYNYPTYGFNGLVGFQFSY